MAQGKKYSDDIKERAYALLATGNNVQVVAEKLKLPYTTVMSWYKKWQSENGSEKENNLVELRNKNKEKFVNKAWGLIMGSTSIAERRIERALYFEERIDTVADTILKHAESIARESGSSWDEVVNLVKELKGFKSFRLAELSSLIGVMYDKQALINKEATGIYECKKFEDFN